MAPRASARSALSGSEAAQVSRNKTARLSRRSAAHYWPHCFRSRIGITALSQQPARPAIQQRRRAQRLTSRKKYRPLAMTANMLDRVAPPSGEPINNLLLELS